jgi:hypothetical protein
LNRDYSSHNFRNNVFAVTEMSRDELSSPLEEKNISIHHTFLYGSTQPHNEGQQLAHIGAYFREPYHCLKIPQ